MKNVIERLLNLLAFLLTCGRPVTADEIRETVAGYDRENDVAFHRMFERDKDLLRSMGIPLGMTFTDAWEVEQGYVVPPQDYELADPGLTDEERAALWLAAQIVRLGGQPTGADAMFKLGGAPMTAAGEPLAADLGLSADDLGTIFSAVAEHRILSFDYRERARKIKPYGMIHRRGHWYVVGEANGEMRAFRVDRGEGFTAGPQAEAFERPADFDIRSSIPAAPWEAGDADIVAEVRFDANVAWWAGRQLPKGAERLTHPDGGLTARLPVANTDAFIGWMIGFIDEAEVIGPPELRAEFIERVRG